MEEGTPLSEALKVNDFEILILIEYDGYQHKKERIDELLNKIGEAKKLRGDFLF